jgi:voltage-gated potassium channel
VVGVGIFGTFTGYLANLFLAPRKSMTRSEPQSDARSRLEALNGLVGQQQAETRALEELLAVPEG